MIKIEKNIPLPGPNDFGSRVPPKYPFAAMEVGDSLLMVGLTQPKASAASKYVAKTRNMKFTTRKVEGGIRIWRIK